MVADHLFPLRLDGGAEKVVGGGFSVGSAGDKDLLLYLAGELF